MVQQSETFLEEVKLLLSLSDMQVLICGGLCLYIVFWGEVFRTPCFFKEETPCLSLLQVLFINILISLAMLGLHCDMWDLFVVAYKLLVVASGIQFRDQGLNRASALGAQSQPLNHQGSPVYLFFKSLGFLICKIRNF